jgi:hypothetical protein
MPGSDDVPNPCSPDRQKMLDDAFEEAKKWLDKAEKAIIAYNNAPEKKKPNVAADSLKKHFKWTEEIRKQASFPDVPGKFVPSIIKSLRQHIGGPHTANCVVDVEKKVFARVSGGQLRSNFFSYSPEYFELGKSGTERQARRILRARVILHEMLHSWEGMGLAREIYAGEAEYPGQRTENAVENPDSYACLIRDLALEKVSGYELDSK